MPRVADSTKMNICCPFEGCSGKFSRTRKLSLHMERDHAFHCNRIELTCPSRDVFQRWLENLNSLSNVSFVCWHGRKTSYVLQCSKSRKGKKKLVSEKKHTTKLDIICPAHIGVCIRDDGVVMASAQLSHYGHEVSPAVFDIPPPEEGTILYPKGENAMQEEGLIDDEDEEEIFAETDGGDDADDNKIGFGLKDLANIATAIGLNGDLRNLTAVSMDLGSEAFLEAQQPLNIAGSAQNSSPSEAQKPEEERAEKSPAELQPNADVSPPAASAKEAELASPVDEQPESANSFQSEVRHSVATFADIVKIFDDIGPDDLYSHEDQEAIIDKLDSSMNFLRQAAERIVRRASVIVSDSSSLNENPSLPQSSSSNRRKRRQPVAFDLDQ